MNPVTTAADRKTSILLPVMALLAALALCTVACFLGAAALRALPLAQFNRELLTQRQDAARNRLSGEAKDAFDLQRVAATIAVAVHPASVSPQVPRAAVDLALRAQTTQLGRLLAAAAGLVYAEVAAVGPDQTWAAVRPYFEGLADARFPHHLAAMQAAFAAEYDHPPIAPGTARQLAAQVGDSYSITLQYLCQQIDALIASRTQAGDTNAARLLRQIEYNLLREWTLTPGPAGLRMLAADLLAARLEREARDGDANQARVAQCIRAWRTAYRDAARNRPESGLGVGGDPELVPASSRSVLRGIARSAVLLATTLLVAAVALISAYLACTRAALMKSRRPWLAGAASVAGLSLVTIAFSSWQHHTLHEELRFLAVRYADTGAASARALLWNPTYGSRTLITATAAAIAWVALATFVFAPKTADARERRSFATGITISALLLAIASIVSVLTLQSAIRTRETELASAYSAGVIQTVAGKDADAQLAALRDWHP